MNISNKKRRAALGDVSNEVEIQKHGAKRKCTVLKSNAAPALAGHKDGKSSESSLSQEVEKHNRTEKQKPVLKSKISVHLKVLSSKPANQRKSCNVSKLCSPIQKLTVNKSCKKLCAAKTETNCGKNKSYLSSAPATSTIHTIAIEDLSSQISTQATQSTPSKISTQSTTVIEIIAASLKTLKTTAVQSAKAAKATKTDKALRNVHSTGAELISEIEVSELKTTLAQTTTASKVTSVTSVASVTTASKVTSVAEKAAVTSVASVTSVAERAAVEASLSTRGELQEAGRQALGSTREVHSPNSNFIPALHSTTNPQATSPPAIDITAHQATCSPPIDITAHQATSSPAIDTTAHQPTFPPAIDTTATNDSSSKWVDIDSEQHNLYYMSDYVNDIFQHYKKRELLTQVPDYMGAQAEISGEMRMVLVDWLVEVQQSFELNHETLYMAVKLVDVYSSRRPVAKSQLQLVAAVALNLAAKFEERCPPMIADFTFICDDAYNKQEFLKMEMEVLLVCDFNLSLPLSYTFLRRYAMCARVTLCTLTLSRFILESSLLHYNFVCHLESKMASASLFIAMAMNKDGSWDGTLRHYTGYRCGELVDEVVKLNHMMHHPCSNITTILSKYSHPIFHEVAKIEMVSTLHLRSLLRACVV